MMKNSSTNHLHRSTEKLQGPRVIVDTRLRNSNPPWPSPAAFINVSKFGVNAMTYETE